PIHSMYVDTSDHSQNPSKHNNVRNTTHRGDFTSHAWPFANLGGILMANSLHYVSEQETFISACAPRMTVPRRFLIVEYDTNEASRWIPHPVGRARVTELFAAAGYSSLRLSRSRPSMFRRAPLYAALATT